jgi:NADP-dependent 3-hydroxy acid dehydrogenase YdfG
VRSPFKSEVRARDAIAEIKAQVGVNAQASALFLGLADLGSVDRCAAQLNKQIGQKSVLMLNAGVMAIPERRETRGRI